LENAAYYTKGTTVMKVSIHHTLACCFAGIAFGIQSKSSDSNGKSPDKENGLPTLEDGEQL
jgi:hypothetical protein